MTGIKIDLGSTSAPALHPDLGPGAGQARDDALDEQAREGMTGALPPASSSESERQAGADLDAALAEAHEVPETQGLELDLENATLLVRCPDCGKPKAFAGAPCDCQG